MNKKHYYWFNIGLAYIYGQISWYGGSYSDSVLIMGLGLLSFVTIIIYSKIVQKELNKNEI